MALGLNYMANLFPHILGRVCTHPCESACRRVRLMNRYQFVRLRERRRILQTKISCKKFDCKKKDRKEGSHNRRWPLPGLAAGNDFGDYGA